MDNEINFEEMLNNSFKNIKVGEVISGKIIEINDKGEIFLDLGYKADGIISKEEYSNDENINPKDDLKVGEEIEAEVIKINDGFGNVLLSYKRCKDKVVRKELLEKIDKKEIFEEKVISVDKNGIKVLYKGLIKIFIPMSLSNIKRNENIEDYIGRIVKFRIIENDNSLRKVIGSIKDVADEEKKLQDEEFWKSIEVGKKYKGIVSSISSYGAFVDIGGYQGLMHISDIAWGRNKNIRDILKENQEINVTVKELDKENKRFKLSFDDKGEDPWDKVKEKYSIGDVVKVKISKIMPFGAFVELEEGIEGLVHISEVCERKISKVEEELEIGKHVNAKIIDLDVEKKKIGLSIRELEGTSKEYKEE